MTAVAEAPVAKPEPPPPPRFIMQRPARGQTVQWYPHACKEDEPEIAFVTRVGHSNLVLNINGMARASVPHIDDPRLIENENRRENGAWDFTDADRERVEMKKRVESLEADVKALKELLDEPVKKGK